MRERETVKKIGRILFPIFLYELLAMIYPWLFGVVTGGRLLLPEAAMWRLTAENLLMLPIFWLLYRRDRRSSFSEKQDQGRSFSIRKVVFAVLGSVCLSRGVNYFLSLTPLPYWFSGYKAASEAIYSSSLLSQIAASAISAPLLEELLMRGLFYERLKAATEMPRAAMVASSIAFGVFHGSVVQGIYAFILGMFFVRAYEACHSLVPVVLAHMAANGASIVAGQIGLPEALYEIPGFYYWVTAGYLLAGIFCWKQIASRRR